MKVDFHRELKTLDGRSIRFNDKERMTLKDVAIEALLAAFDDERQLNGTDKARRYVLSTRIYSSSNADLTTEEVAEIKKVIGKGFGPLIVGQAFDMLEGKTEGPKG